MNEEKSPLPPVDIYVNHLHSANRMYRLYEIKKDKIL
jgi:hypothetical protein